MRKRILLLSLCCILAIFLAIPGVAATLKAKTIQVYTGVTIHIDDVLLNPKDVTGKTVDAFIYDGTTYLPVRAISEALGKEVQWDGKTSTVYIGKHLNSSTYLLNVCPAYLSCEYATPATVNMAGKKYGNCCTFGCAGWALYNLNGQYDTLSFDVGHIDGQGMHYGSLEIYLDGELEFAMDLDPNAMPEHIKVPLNGAAQMKIALDSGYLWKDYALANVQVS